jgi:hypothetical protein
VARDTELPGAPEAFTRCREGGTNPGLSGPGQIYTGADLYKGGSMPTKPAVTMQDLELERAELLPSRETLSVTNYYPTFNITKGRGTASPPSPGFSMSPL